MKDMQNRASAPEEILLFLSRPFYEMASRKKTRKPDGSTAAKPGREARPGGAEIEDRHNPTSSHVLYQNGT